MKDTKKVMTMMIIIFLPDLKPSTTQDFSENHCLYFSCHLIIRHEVNTHISYLVYVFSVFCFFFSSKCNRHNFVLTKEKPGMENKKLEMIPVLNTCSLNSTINTCSKFISFIVVFYLESDFHSAIFTALLAWLTNARNITEKKRHVCFFILIMKSDQCKMQTADLQTSCG